MNTTDYFQRLSQYNRWMNDRLYHICETIPDSVRKEDRGAFFRSLHGTLNHILLADQVWLGRFQQRLFPINSLDQELYADFAEMYQQRQQIDIEIQTWVDTLTHEKLAAPFKIISFSNQKESIFPLWHVVTHFFNHQTHHRGQLTTLLSQCGYDFGITDFLRLPNTEIT